MKTQTEILNEIKNNIKHYWKFQRKDDINGTIFNRVINRASTLLWVLYDYSYKEVCPYCGEIMECDAVDVGVGYQQCGPYHCENCNASEIHSEDKLELDEDEKMTGYYKNKISPLANTCCGKLVDHKEAKRLYDIGCLDNCKPYIYKKETENEFTEI